MGHTTGKIEAVLPLAPETEGTAIRRFKTGVAVTVGSSSLRSVLSALGAALTAAERQDTRCLIKEDGGDPDLDDFAAVTSLDSLIQLVRGEWLLDVLREGRLTTHFQPIVRCETPHRAHAQECLLRWTDETGAVKPPGPLFDVARGAGLMFQLDRAARESAVRTAARQGVGETLFINFAPTAIYDPENCLRTTLAEIDRLGIPRASIVFEVVETERVADPDHLRNILAFYRRNGFRVALDDLGAGFASLSLLRDLNPDIVKIDRELISGVDADAFKQSVVHHIIGLSRDVGIEVVAEGVETAGEAEWLTGQRVDYLQGFYFSRPSEAPVSILERKDGTP